MLIPGLKMIKSSNCLGSQKSEFRRQNEETILVKDPAGYGDVFELA
jgi:hypothetical protein